MSVERGARVSRERKACIGPEERGREGERAEGEREGEDSEELSECVFVAAGFAVGR